MTHKRTWACSGAFIFIAFLFFCSCNPKAVDVTDEIMEANKSFMEAFNNGDAQAVASNYTEKGKLLPPNSDVIQGQEGIADFWQGAMDMGVNKAVLKTEWAKSFGEVANEEGRYQLYAGDDMLVDQGKYIVIWKKVDGQWKLCIDIWNTSNPPPQASAATNDTIQ